MTDRTFFVVIALLAAVVAAACGGGDAGLTRAEVQEIARAEVASAPAAPPGLSRSEAEVIVQAAISGMPQPQPGLTRAEVEEIVQAAVAGIPAPEPGLAAADVERIVRSAIAAVHPPEPGLTDADARRIARNAVASIPPRSAPADYTKFFVNNAISRYESEGLEATLAYYNREESIDGQWYVFIVDENDIVAAHPDARLLGLDLKGWVGTDANGYDFGLEMLSATGAGKWVSYVYRNPENGGIGSGNFGDLELKNSWVVRRDGLLFGSGWYIDADEFTKMLVSVAVDQFRSGGLEATMAYFAGPESVLAGLEVAIAYYNEAETVDGKWSAFIALAENGTIVAHSDPARIGSNLQDLFGTSSIEATEQGGWVTTDTARMWVAGSGGFVFGSGWHRDRD